MLAPDGHHYWQVSDTYTEAWRQLPSGDREDTLTQMRDSGDLDDECKTYSLLRWETDADGLVSLICGRISGSKASGWKFDQNNPPSLSASSRPTSQLVLKPNGASEGAWVR